MELIKFPEGTVVPPEELDAFMRATEQRMKIQIRVSLLETMERVTQGKVSNVVVIELGPQSFTAVAHVAPWMDIEEIKNRLAEVLPGLQPNGL